MSPEPLSTTTPIVHGAGSVGAVTVFVAPLLPFRPATSIAVTSEACASGESAPPALGASSYSSTAFMQTYVIRCRTASTSPAPHRQNRRRLEGSDRRSRARAPRGRGRPRPGSTPRPLVRGERDGGG